MAVTNTPIFTQSPKLGVAAIAAANTAIDGSGSIVTGFTAGANGAYIKKVTFTSSQATAAAYGAKVFRVWLSTDGGTTWYLRAESAITAVTPSTTAIGATATVTFPDGLVIDALAKVGVTQSVYAGVQDRTAVVVEGSDY